jgi:hypothetical protein
MPPPEQDLHGPREKPLFLQINDEISGNRSKPVSGMSFAGDRDLLLYVVFSCGLSDANRADDYLTVFPVWRYG